MINAFSSNLNIVKSSLEDEALAILLNYEMIYPIG